MNGISKRISKGWRAIRCLVEGHNYVSKREGWNPATGNAGRLVIRCEHCNVSHNVLPIPTAIRGNN